MYVGYRYYIKNFMYVKIRLGWDRGFIYLLLYLIMKSANIDHFLLHTHEIYFKIENPKTSFRMVLKLFYIGKHKTRLLQNYNQCYIPLDILRIFKQKSLSHTFPLTGKKICFENLPLSSYSFSYSLKLNVI